MIMTAVEHHEAAELARLRARLAVEVPKACASLDALGVSFEVVGSYARGDLRLDSDVDFLILDLNGVSPGQAYAAIAEHVCSVRFDLVLGEDMTAESLAFMRRDALARVP